MKTIGIIGGMGPEAALRLCLQIINLKDAKKDQEHIPTILFNNTQVPDRSDAIIRGKDTPLPVLLEMVKKAEDAGADILAMPCNSAHHWYDQLKSSTKLNFVNMLFETCNFIKEKNPNARVGILATTGTIEWGGYQRKLKALGISYFVPDKASQDEDVMPALRMIKAGNKEKALLNLKRAMSKLSDVDLYLAGCTEIPIVLNGENIIDPSEVLARKLISLAE
jgi:aspartate racemase